MASLSTSSSDSTSHPSMWSKIRSAAISVKDETSRALHEAKSTPTKILCVGCGTLLLVPESLFDWKCEGVGHVNPNSYDKCTATDCPKSKPAHRTEPAIRCASCHTITQVPFTNAEKQLRETGRTIKNQYEFMKSKPTTFYCTNCDNLLMVPTGPWICQTCTNVNAQELEKCSSCIQKKADQKVMCGVCKRSTQIPSLNIVNSINKSLRDVSKGTRKIYYDLSKHPYVTCPRCNTNIAVEINKTTITASDKNDLSQEHKEHKEIKEGELNPEMNNFSTVPCGSCGLVLTYIAMPQTNTNNPTPSDSLPLAQPVQMAPTMQENDSISHPVTDTSKSKIA
jgi:hypothetical protein